MITHGQHALFPVGQVVFPDVPADGLAPAQILFGGFFNNIIDDAGLLPKAELPLGDVFGYTFAGVADQRKFKIMDGAGTVGGEVVDQPPLHQLDHKETVAAADHMGPVHHQHGGVVFPAGLHDLFRQNGDSGMVEGGDLIIDILDNIDIDIVDPLLQRQ